MIPWKKNLQVFLVFNAEIYAIDVTLNFISQNKNEKYIIFSDSPSVIAAIKKNI